MLDNTIIHLCLPQSILPWMGAEEKIPMLLCFFFKGLTEI